MIIDKAEFRAYMERLIDRFEILEEKMDRMLKKKTCLDGEDLLDNYDLMNFLNVSNRTLQRFRTSGDLPYLKINGKIFYKLSDVNRFIREIYEAGNVRSAKQRQIPPRTDKNKV